MYLPDLPTGERKQKIHPKERLLAGSHNQRVLFTKEINELICGFTLDHIQRKQVETMFNALVEFIESQKKNYTSETIKLQILYFKNS